MTCVWDVDPEVLAEAWDSYDESVQERALLLATSTLQTLTNYRVGSCPITIRPCPETSRCGCDWNPLSHSGATGPVLWDGNWYNTCRHRTRCGPLSEIDIPGPVGYVSELRIDGVDQDLWNGDWRLDDGHLLVWQGLGASPVPLTQNLSRPDTEVGTWSLTYSRSYPVLADARIAVSQLALEMAAAITPRKKCALPRGVTNVVRNGVSFSLEAGLFTNGLTGLDAVDAFILKWAPAGGPSQTAVVFDPGKRSPRRTNAVPSRGPLGSV